MLPGKSRLSEQRLSQLDKIKKLSSSSEKEIKKKETLLIPIMVDTAVMDSDQTWAVDLRRSRHIADFTNWSDPESYNKAFERLLHILKTK